MSAQRPRMDGMVCLVTGANAGIGKEAARGLALRGATVVLVSRDRSRGEAARAEIGAAAGPDRVDLLLADLASLASVRRLVEAFRARYSRLHVLVNNAGVYRHRYEETEDGIERTFAVNHLAHFLLTTELLDLLRASAPARIVNVTSAAHHRGRLDLDRLGDRARYHGFQAYADAKLANVLFTYELARRLEGTGVTANCVHPGMVATHIWNTNPNLLSRMMALFKPFMLRPERAAEAVVYLAASPDVEGVSGVYYDRKTPVRSSDRSRDPVLAQELWERSERLTG